MAPLVSGFAAGLSGGGENLGNAHGSITLDIADLLRAEQASKTIGQNIEKNLGAGGKAATALGRDVASVRTAADKAKLGSLGREVAAGSKDIQQAAIEYRSFKDSLGEVENQAKKTAQSGRTLGDAFRQGLSGLGNAIQSFRGELVTIGATGALISVFGLNAARDIRNARIRLSQFVETEEEANALMNRLTDSANEFGLEIGGVFTLASALLPKLEGGTEELDEWIIRAARLRTVNPFARVGDDVRAINELISGQTVSITRLFNIDPGIVREAKEQFQDAGQQLDYILDRMGATEESARAMSDPLVAIKNELKLIGAVGFEPILRWLREILPEVRQFLEQLRDTRPEVLEIGAAFAAAAAVGAPFLLFLGQVLSTAQKLKTLGLAGALGKIGLAGAAIGVTAIGVTAGTQAIARKKGDVPELENASFFKIMAEGLKALADLFFGFIALLQPAFQAIVDGMLNFAGTVVAIYTGLGHLLNRIGNLLPDELGGDDLKDAGRAIVEAGQGAAELVENLKKANESGVENSLALIQEHRQRFRDFLDGLFRSGEGEAGTAPGSSISTGTAGLSEMQLEQAAAWEEYQEQIAAIEQRGQEQRLAITAQYEAQRTSIIAQYEKQTAREAADFARHRARAIAQTQDEIDDIRGRALTNEAKWWQELQDIIAEARAESAARIAEIEADAARTREQMERQHRDNLLSAASRLDARAVADEQRRFRTQSTNFEQDLQARLEKERQNLAERIAQEQQGHQERIAAERKSNEERIAAILEAQAERFAIEDEERAIRLDRQEQDHEAQLDQLRKANRQRLDEQKDQQRKELEEARQQFIKASLQLADFYRQWQGTQLMEQQASLKEWQRFWKDWYAIQAGGQATAGTGTGPGGGTPPPGGGTGTPPEGERPSRVQLELLAVQLLRQSGASPEYIDEVRRSWATWDDARLAKWIERTFGYDVPGYQQGIGRVPRDQLAYIHKDEAVLNKQDAALWRAMGGSSSMSASYANTSNRMNINMSFYGVKDAHDIGKVVREEMTILFKGAA